MSSAQPYTGFNPDTTLRKLLASKLKKAHSVIAEVGKNGFPSEDDKAYANFVPVFRDIPVLKEIPPNFRLRLSNCFEALSFQSFDTICDMSEK